MTIEFAESEGTYTGRGENGREWRIAPTRTGWRLAFQDIGDTVPTNAGVHATLSAAQAEARRAPSRGRGR
jgi:hypothetical protein